MNPEVARRFEANQERGTGVSNDKLGMWIFLASEVVFFAVLIAAVITLSLGQGRNDWVHIQHDFVKHSLPLATTNTFILILSSVFIVSALDAIQKGNQRMMMFWLSLTLIGGLVFLFNQSLEWTALSNELQTAVGAPGLAGAQLSPFGASFYTVTGFHGAHVAIGVLLLLYVMMRGLRGDFTPRKYNALEMFGLYWHFVDLVWIILFTVLYLI
jgi:cytochrome c oxidase subunit III